MIKIYKIAFLVMTLIVAISPLYAQGAPPPTPIDGGLSLLLLAGGAYGAKKLYNSIKEK